MNPLPATAAARASHAARSEAFHLLVMVAIGVVVGLIALFIVRY
jgi:hypothetical protein